MVLEEENQRMHKVYKLERAARKAEWIRIIVNWRSSGLKREEYCKQQGLKFNDIKRWSYIISREKREAAQQRLINQGQFAEVEITTEGKLASCIKLEHRAGFWLEVGVDTDKALLKEVMAMLAGVVC
jgi:hypothetical protein